MRPRPVHPALLSLAVAAFRAGRGPKLSPAEVWRSAWGRSRPTRPTRRGRTRRSTRPSPPPGPRGSRGSPSPRLRRCASRRRPTARRSPSASRGRRLPRRRGRPRALRRRLRGAAPHDPRRDLPAPQMGEPGRPVEITYWRASWEAWKGGRPDDIHALYPNTATPHYPPDAASLTPGSPDQVAMAKTVQPRPRRREPDGRAARPGGPGPGGRRARHPSPRLRADLFRVREAKRDGMGGRPRPAAPEGAPGRRALAGRRRRVARRGEGSRVAQDALGLDPARSRGA